MDFAVIDVTFFIISMALFLIILDGHICGIILDGAAARVVEYVTVLCHVGLFVCLMLSRVPLEFLALVFMASVFSYCLAFYVRYRIDEHRRASRIQEEASSNADLSEQDSSLSDAPSAEQICTAEDEPVAEQESCLCDEAASDNSENKDGEEGTV